MNVQKRFCILMIFWDNLRFLRRGSVFFRLLPLWTLQNAFFMNFQDTMDILRFLCGPPEEFLITSAEVYTQGFIWRGGGYLSPLVLGIMSASPLEIYCLTVSRVLWCPPPLRVHISPLDNEPWYLFQFHNRLFCCCFFYSQWLFI